MQKVRELSILIECSNGSTPTLATLKKYISMLSAMGYKTLYLGLTDAFKADGEPYFNYKRGGYTKEDLRVLDAYAKARGIEIIASIQTLAHLHYLKKYNVYTPLFDTDNVLMVGKPEVYELIDHLFGTISAGLSSRRIHIGFDEAYGIGTGRYMRENGYRPPRELMAEHLAKVTELAKKYGYSCEIWGDMFFEGSGAERRVAENMRISLPQGVKLIEWEYYEAEKEILRNIIAEGKTICRELAFAGSAFKFCGFAPSNNYSISRIVPQLDVCAECGVEQYILTLWSDGGGLCSIFSSLPAVYAAAEYACGRWDGKGMPDRAKFTEITGASYEDLFSLDYLNDPFCKNLTVLNSRSYWILFSDILLGNYDAYLSEGTDKAYVLLAQEYRKRASGAFAYLFETAAALAELLGVKAKIGSDLRRAYAEKAAEDIAAIAGQTMPRLEERLGTFERAFEKQWRCENFCFGIEVVQLFLGGLRSRFRYIRERLVSWLQTGETIGELEGTWLPPCIIPPVTEDSCLEMNYRNLLSYCGI